MAYTQSLENQIADLRRAIKALEDGLEVYADADNWLRVWNEWGEETTSLLYLNPGEGPHEIAQRALKLSAHYRTRRDH